MMMMKAEAVAVLLDSIVDFRIDRADDGDNDGVVLGD